MTALLTPPTTPWALPFFDEVHRDVAARLVGWMKCKQVDETDDRRACRQWVQLLGEGQWLRYCVPSGAGGAAGVLGGALATLDSRALVVIRETLAFYSPLADFAFAMQGLGSGAITLAGTPAQQAAYLPQVATGEKIAAFALRTLCITPCGLWLRGLGRSAALFFLPIAGLLAAKRRLAAHPDPRTTVPPELCRGSLSEADAGSDAGAMRTCALMAESSWTINGSKTWITNGGIADFYVTFAKTDGDAGVRGITAFIIDADTPGVDSSEHIAVMAPHPLATLKFSDCRLAAACQLGAVHGGFKLAMQTLDIFRASVAGAATGMARRALAEAIHFSKQRQMFGQTQQLIIGKAVLR